jgi:hypothetical protein
MCTSVFPLFCCHPLVYLRMATLLSVSRVFLGRNSEFLVRFRVCLGVFSLHSGAGRRFLPPFDGKFLPRKCPDSLPACWSSMVLVSSSLDGLAGVSLRFLAGARTASQAQLPLPTALGPQLTLSALASSSYPFGKCSGRFSTDVLFGRVDIGTVGQVFCGGTNSCSVTPACWTLLLSRAWSTPSFRLRLPETLTRALHL